MSEDCGWCTVIYNTQEEAGVVIRVSDTHLFQNLCDQIKTVLRHSPQAVERFVEDPEVVSAGIGIA